ncbi:MAG: glycosyltransferase, partial [Clostridiaceae bacterium]
MEPIRILNVVGRMDRGGIETMIMNIYRNIDRNKVQFDFLAHYGKEADYNDEIRSLGGKIYEMPVIKTTEKTYYNKFFQYRRALIEFFKNHQEYKVLHGHMTNTASIYMPIAKKYGNINCLISHSHLTRARQGLTGTVTNILQIPLRKCATEYFSCSNEAGKWLYKKKDFDNGKVRIVKNAIDSDLFVYNYEKRKKKREELGINGNLVLGHIGRFFEQKNHDFLIDVFNEVYKMNDKAVLILIGEGVLMTEIKGKVNKFGLDKNVIFLGLRSDI